MLVSGTSVIQIGHDTRDNNAMHLGKLFLHEYSILILNFKTGPFGV